MSLKVKICGITNAEDGLLALSLGADELGFVLAPSPRRVEPEALKSVLEALRGDGRARAFRAIGVFVNEEAGAMRDIVSYAGLDAAQVHGDETPTACAGFDFPWYRALRVGGVVDALRKASARWDCPRLLVDASSRSAYGGTGSSVGALAALAARALTKGRGKEFFVAGGIRPENVARLVRALSPDGIDVSSGVEERPGRKSRTRLEALFGEIGRERARAKGVEDAAR
jgi:phosphoribosylanthranilate isomerase